LRDLVDGLQAPASDSQTNSDPWRPPWPPTTSTLTVGSEFW